ncbi:hypothetical protein B0H11DRAFT_1938652 [Mycena galericulata]|nr:hypothetical protein B0H11DRAFT_1938652 [Mycena galericulata]
MLERNPDWIKCRTPRYLPPPRIIVPAIEHVFNSYGNAIDAQSGLPLFSDKTWQKANAVLDLARQGYLSDIQGVQLYDKDSIDKYGLWKLTGKRGTNKTEGEFNSENRQMRSTSTRLTGSTTTAPPHTISTELAVSRPRDMFEPMPAASNSITDE